jgi:hypothetical protein
MRRGFPGISACDYPGTDEAGECAMIREACTGASIRNAPLRDNAAFAVQ